MRRMKNFMFSGLLLAAVSVSAEVPPSIHVDGKNLTDTHGNKVVLHGVMDTPSPYFNNYRWGHRVFRQALHGYYGFHAGSLLQCVPASFGSLLDE